MSAPKRLTKKKKNSTKISSAMAKASGRAATLIFAIALLISLTLMAGAHSARSQALRANATLRSTGASTISSGQLKIHISNAGITPASATISGGIIHLKIENSSEFEEIKLRVRRESGESVREIVVPEKTREFDTELELGAGRYVLTEASTTAWACQLTVQ